MYVQREKMGLLSKKVPLLEYGSPSWTNFELLRYFRRDRNRFLVKKAHNPLRHGLERLAPHRELIWTLCGFFLQGRLSITTQPILENRANFRLPRTLRDFEVIFDWTLMHISHFSIEYEMDRYDLHKGSNMKCKEIIQFITCWLRNYIEESRAKGFVVGVSGGIDSAVSSTLAARTGIPLLCVEMPIYQRQVQLSKAQNHIAFLKKNYPNTRSLEVELTPVFDAFVKALPKAEGIRKKETSLVNVRARLRMTTLYYFSGLYDYLVVGTGNKVEDFSIGFFTKYGDGGVDLSPIADLTKSQVYKLGEELGIIESIMSAPPTNGLWTDNRTDEDQIGASYPELEWAMDFCGDESALNQRQREVLNIYRSLRNSNLHKMIPVPVCKIPRDLLYPTNSKRQL